MLRIPLRCSPLRTLSTRFAGRLLLALFLFTPLACGSGSDPAGTDDDGNQGGSVNGEQTLTILYTTDERGRIEPGPGTEGAARLMGLWRSSEGFDREGDFLVLSGGNSWMGPPVSAWFEGASTVEVMKKMWYSGTAIGNQEYLFGLEALRSRVSEAGFPFLSANVRQKTNGSPPDFATPFTVRNVNGLHVGVVGLTSVETPSTSAAKAVEGLDFIPYVQALNEVVPQARGAGADLVLVVAHICHDEMLQILPAARQLGVTMIAGAYCGEKVSQVVDGVALLVPGPYFSEYGRVTIRVRSKNAEVLQITSQVRTNSGGSPDEEVEVTVQKWQDQAEHELSTVIGYVNDAVPNESTALYNLVMDSWLFTFPSADIAMLNDGAVRQGLPAGAITKSAVVGMLPFPNNLVELELTGAQLVDCLQPSTILAGMSTVGGYFHSDGTPLNPDSVYHVLVTDFMHGQASYNYRLYDTDPIETGMVYHQPTLLYLQSLGTTDANPLDPLLDHTPRR